MLLACVACFAMGFAQSPEEAVSADSAEPTITEQPVAHEPGAVDLAAPVLGAGGRVATGVLPEAHGWIVVPASDAQRPDPGARKSTGAPWILLHLPPRQASIHGGVEGAGRRSRSLAAEPLGLAASGRRVFVFSANDAPPDEAGRARYSVRTIEARPTAVPGIWNDWPSGRLESLPPLEVEGRAVGFAGSDAGPALLTQTNDGYRLAAFTESAWSIAPIPAEMIREIGVDDANAPSLLGSPDALAVVGPSGVLVHAAVESVDSASTDASAWRVERIAIPAGATPLGFAGGDLIVWITAERGAESAGAAAVSLVRLNAEGVTPLASFDLPADLAFLGLVTLPDQSGRASIVLGISEAADAERGAASPREGLIRYRLVEVSLSTGDLLYDGPVDRRAPVSAEEFKVLAALLILVMSVSLVVVLFPIRGENELRIPDNCALATPARRFLATAIDVAVAVAIVSRISGVPFDKIIGLEVLIATDRSWLTLPAVLLVGFVCSAAGEAICSASIGKLALGCRVVRTPAPAGVRTGSAKAARVGLLGAVVRNGVKWILPPAASLAMIEPTGRHRGDYLAAAVVVVPLDDDRSESEPAEPIDDDSSDTDD